MEAGKRTIYDIIKASRMLEVPFFQRAYVWEEPQWERLLEDAETVTRTREPYLLARSFLSRS